MPGTPALVGSYTPASDHNPIPAFLARPLAAAEQIGKGQFATVNASGHAVLNNGTVPNQLPAGVGDPSELSDVSATAGLASARFSERHFYGLPASTITNDGFTDADFGVPFWIAGEATPGRKTNDSGNNRSLGGLVLGLAQDGTPYLWCGVLAGLIARSVLVSSSVMGGFYDHSVDGSAGAATAEKTMHRTPTHGIVTKISLLTLGSLVADNTDFVTINVYKADGSGGTHVLIGSYISSIAQQGGLTAGVTKDFVLSGVAGATSLLETDIISYEVIKSGAGKIVPVSTIRVIQKAI